MKPPPLPAGFSLEPARSGHLRVLRPDGQPLRTDRGVPLMVSGSPSRATTTRNDIARIRRAIANLAQGGTT